MSCSGICLSDRWSLYVFINCLYILKYLVFFLDVFVIEFVLNLSVSYILCIL